MWAKWAKSKKNGFTIVELLIVIVVIAILAAITIVAFNGVQNRARSSSASSALAQAKKKLEVYKVDYNSYPGNGSLSAAGISDADVSYQYNSISNNTSYCLTGTIGTVSYNISPTSIPNEGACPGHTSGGNTLVTNIMTNSSFESGTTGWSNYTGGVASQVSGDGVVIGNSAMEVSVTAAGQSGVRYVTPALAANTAYTFSIYITPISGDITSLGINIGDGAGTRANNAFGTSLTLGQTIRKTVSWTSSAGPGTTQIAIFRFAAVSNSAVFRVDAAMLEQGSSATSYNGT